jgi:hypothetical protein
VRGFREGQVSPATNTFIVSRSDDPSGQNRSADKGAGELEGLFILLSAVIVGAMTTSAGETA